MIFAGIVIVFAAADLFLKWVIEKQDPGQFPKPLPKSGGKIWLYRNHNAGFPFGFLDQYGELVRTLPLIVTSALGGIFCYLLREKGSTAKKAGLALILGGSISNLYDRYFRRYVVDYFSFRFGWLKKVVFNLGDLCVFAGSGILMGFEAVSEVREALRKRKGK